jgi:hypothetical protein
MSGQRLGSMGFTGTPHRGLRTRFR